MQGKTIIKIAGVGVVICAIFSHFYRKKRKRTAQIANWLKKGGGEGNQSEKQQQKLQRSRTAQVRRHNIKSCASGHENA